VTGEKLNGKFGKEIIGFSLMGKPYTFMLILYRYLVTGPKSE
jgi:hypothetical protein